VIEKDHSTATVQAVVHFEHQIADRARRERALGIIAEQTDEKGVTLTMTTGSLDWLVGWLLSFQTSASVIEPPELRQKLLLAIAQIQEKITGNE